MLKPIFQLITKTNSFRTKYTEIWLDEQGILWLTCDPGSELDLEEVKACFELYAQMGINIDNKVLQIIDAQNDMTMNKEGRDYAAKHGHQYFIASAIVSNSLAIRLIVNFFNSFYKTQLVPFKIFDSVEMAKLWLNQYRK